MLSITDLHHTKFSYTSCTSCSGELSLTEWDLDDYYFPKFDTINLAPNVHIPWKICGYLDNCLVKSRDDPSKCWKCKSGYLDFESGTCVKECEDIGKFSDTVNMICRKQCGAE